MPIILHSPMLANPCSKAMSPTSSCSLDISESKMTRGISAFACDFAAVSRTTHTIESATSSETILFEEGIVQLQYFQLVYLAAAASRDGCKLHHYLLTKGSS